MLFTIITPSYNSGTFLEQTIQSVLSQQERGIEIQYIIVDGGSTDNTSEILDKHSAAISSVIVEPDTGPANAINKGLRLASGDCVAWLNADDVYFPGTLKRVWQTMEENPAASFCFGSCPIIAEDGQEIRKEITRFKELFFPLSCRFTYQCINYISQPALFMRKSSVESAGFLREDMKAAWDYEFILRLWHAGPAKRIKAPPLSAFRWHEASISGQHFRVQFQEEYDAARQDAGTWALQTMIHYFIHWGIVGSYSLMEKRRNGTPAGQN